MVEMAASNHGLVLGISGISKSNYFATRAPSMVILSPRREAGKGGWEFLDCIEIMGAVAAAAYANSATITGVGMAAQVGAGYFTGRTSGQQKYQDAVRLCRTNEILWNQQQNLEKALSKAAAVDIQMKGLDEASDALREHLDKDVRPQVEQMQKNFLSNFTLFLFFLTVVTALLFFAIDRKAGRLSTLFDQINHVAHLESA
jgi:hypothetical protein